MKKLTFKDRTAKLYRDWFSDILAHKGVWYFFSFCALAAMNRSLFILLTGTFYVDSPDILDSVLEFANTLLAGWLFFSVFFRPNSLRFIPQKYIRKILYEQDRLLAMFFFVFSFRIFNYQVIIDLPPVFDPINMLVQPAEIVKVGP